MPCKMSKCVFVYVMHPPRSQPPPTECRVGEQPFARTCNIYTDVKQKCFPRMFVLGCTSLRLNGGISRLNSLEMPPKKPPAEHFEFNHYVTFLLHCMAPVTASSQFVSCAYLVFTRILFGWCVQLNVNPSNQNVWYTRINVSHQAPSFFIS